MGMLNKVINHFVNKKIIYIYTYVNVYSDVCQKILTISKYNFFRLKIALLWKISATYGIIYLIISLVLLSNKSNANYRFTVSNTHFDLFFSYSILIISLNCKTYAFHALLLIAMYPVDLIKNSI